MAGLHDSATMTDLTLSALRRYSHRIAFKQDGEQRTYRETEEEISLVAGLLQARGLRNGEGVGVLSPNRPGVFSVQSGTGFAGGRITSLHPMGSLDDHRYTCDDAELRFLFVDPGYAARALELLEQCPTVEAVFCFGPTDQAGLEDLPSQLAAVAPLALDYGMRLPEDVSWLAYTGGTTGVPKGVMLQERGVAHMALCGSTGYDLPSERRYLAAAPISHAAGMMIVPTLLKGGCVSMLRSFDPQTWMDTVAADDITVSLLVPTMIYALLDHPGLDSADLSSLHTILYGASPMSPSRLKEGMRRIGPVFAQLYGQAECGGLIASMSRVDHESDDPERLASAGTPMPGARVAILDDQGNPCGMGEPGEVCVQGASVMLGYWNQAELTADTLQGGWLHTGDIAVWTADSFFTLVDRKKDMIVSGGFNVFPREIEDVLSTHPAVSNSAVIGVPDDKWGEAVTALVVLKPGQECDPETLRALVRERKGAIATPKTIEFIDSLPLTAVGKADKKALRARYWGNRTRNVN